MKAKLLYVILVNLISLFACLAQERSYLLEQLKSSEFQKDSLDYLLAICESFDVSDFRKSDSLKLFSEKSLLLAELLGDEEKILKSKIHLANSYVISDTSYYYSTKREITRLYEKRKRYKDAANVHMNIAKSYAYHLDMDKIRRHCNEVLRLAQKENGDDNHQDLQALALYYIANSYLYSDYFELALEYALKMKDLSLEHRLVKRELMSYELLGKIYRALEGLVLGKNEHANEAEQYLNLYYSKAKEVGLQETIYGSAFELGKFYLDRKDYDKSAHYLKESLEQAVLASNTAYVFNNNSHLGAVYLAKEDPESAEGYINEVLSIAERYKFPAHKRAAHMLLVDFYLLKGNLRSAEIHADSVFFISNTLEGIENLLGAYRKLEKVEKATGNYKKALEYDKVADRLGDSIMNLNTLTSINTMKMKHDLDAKVREIDEVKREKELSESKNSAKIAWLSLALVMLSSFFIAFYYRVKNEKVLQERDQISLQQKFLRSQMNPHFIFNAIGSIQNYLFDQKDLSTALHYMSKFGDLMRQILENTREESIPIASEIRMLEDYLDLQLLRYNDMFTYRIKVDPSIDIDSELIPPLIAQPFVENAIEHGKIALIDNGFVEISFNKSNDQLKVEVSDNGRGKKSMLIENRNKSKKSLASTITKERLKNIAKVSKKKFDMKVDYTDQLTRVHILIP